MLGEGAWVAGGQVVSALGTVAGVRVLTECVRPNELGAVSLIVGLIALSANTFCLPWIRGAFRFLPEVAQAGQSAWLRTTVVRKLARAVVWLAAGFLLAGVVAQAWGGFSFWALAFAAGLLGVEVFQRFETNLLAAARRQRGYAIWTSADVCLRPAAAATSVWFFGASPQAILGGYLCGAAGVYCVARSLVRNSERSALATAANSSASDSAGHASALTTTEPRAGLRAELRRYVLPLMPLAIVGWGTATADRYIVWWGLGSVAVGLYATIYGLVGRLFSMVLTPVELTLRPVYFAAVATRDRARARVVFRTWLAIVLVSTASVVAGLYLLGDWLVFLLLAEEYRSVATIMPILGVAFATMGLAALVNEINAAYKNTRAVLCSEVLAAIVTIAAAFPLIRWFGLTGAALATWLAYTVQLCAACVIARRVWKQQVA